jgi:deoxyadenosine/deoxycytidine kinase
MAKKKKASKPIAKKKAKPVVKAKSKVKTKAKPVVKAKPVAKAKTVAKKVEKPQPKPPKAAEKKAVSKPTGNKPLKNVKHVAIAGNIGAGKTTLTKILSKHFGWIPHFEDVDNNPYLNDFYEDMPRWSFNLQVHFLNSRFSSIIEIQEGTEIVIQDRTIHEDAMIFAPNLHSMGLMSTRDFENYTRLYKTISSRIKAPDLLIYLKGTVPTLVNQIQKRGREYEDNLRLDYLRRLNEYYEKWISSYDAGRLLVIDIDKVNFAEDEEAQHDVINRVRAELYGLF